MLALIAYIAVIFLANWAIQTFHLVPVGFGLMAPAGVYFAGLAFTLRDLVQDKLGRNWTIGAILAGAALSYAIEPKFALASGAAFLVSELLDFAVYTPLRKRNWMMAVTISNLVGLVADSALFLWLAFGSIAYLQGQVVGKLWMTIAAVALLWLYRRHRQQAI
ncbi:MAG: VUT family protein [Alphaproteobacteria bacterium]|nr:VUT family protein [Alphaproteobacteria bacterium]